MRHPIRWLAPAAVALVLAPRPAQADCAPTPLWSHTSSVTPLVSNTTLSLLNRSYHAAPPGTLVDLTLDVGLAADPSPNRLLVASTHALHRYCIPWSTNVPVRDEFQPEAERATLRPNAPNPFHESTRIDYDLARPGRVEIQLFDVAGKRLRQWVREHATAGAQSITWDGTDEAGRRAPSGVYFCRLRVKDATGGESERSGTVLRLE